jgi:hypothetical protein
MTELELLNLARSATANELGSFGEMITITFAMIVAIYYFLSKAKLVLRVFSFVVYLLGMLVFLGEMLIETNIKFAAVNALKALPPAHISIPSQQYLVVSGSWLTIATSVAFNSTFWLLMLGVFYLLFFGRRHLAGNGSQKDRDGP